MGCSTKTTALLKEGNPSNQAAEGARTQTDMVFHQVILAIVVCVQYDQTLQNYQQSVQRMAQTAGSFQKKDDTFPHAGARFFTYLCRWHQVPI